MSELLKLFPNTPRERAAHNVFQFLKQQRVSSPPSLTPVLLGQQPKSLQNFLITFPINYAVASLLPLSRTTRLLWQRHFQKA